MKIPLELKCPNPTCGAPHTHVVHLSDPSVDFICERCGRNCYGIPALDMTVGALILLRSWHELEIEKDYDMAIVLAATALECEFSRLYCKWKEVEALAGEVPFDVEACEKELRDMRKVTDKIKNISALLCAGGIEAFVKSSDKWKKAIGEDPPSLHLGSLAADCQETVFRPRNKVLHQGKANHTRDDASECYRIADIGICILKDMDKVRLRVFESSH